MEETFPLSDFGTLFKWDTKEQRETRQKEAINEAIKEQLKEIERQRGAGYSDKKILEKVLHLPRVKPQKFKELCDILRNENSKEY